MTCLAAGKSSVIEVEPLLAWLASCQANRGCFRCCWCFGSTVEACSTLLPQPAGAAGPGCRSLRLLGAGLWVLGRSLQLYPAVFRLPAHSRPIVGRLTHSAGGHVPHSAGWCCLAAWPPAAPPDLLLTPWVQLQRCIYLLRLLSSILDCQAAPARFRLVAPDTWPQCCPPALLSFRLGNTRQHARMLG